MRDTGAAAAAAVNVNVGVVVLGDLADFLRDFIDRDVHRAVGVRFGKFFRAAHVNQVLLGGGGEGGGGEQAAEDEFFKHEGSPWVVEKAGNVTGRAKSGQWRGVAGFCFAVSQLPRYAEIATIARLKPLP